MRSCFLIVNYNDFKSTKHLVDNVKNFSCLDEIVIVDNSLLDSETETLLTLEEKKVTIIFNEKNLGYGGAINVGARYLLKKYKECNIIVSNSDVVIMSEEDLLKMINVLGETNVGVVGPQILERGDLLRGRKDVTANQDILANMPIIKDFLDCENNYEDDYYVGECSKVEVISTCFFAIKSQIFKKINFMDENVFLYYEDYILCRKVRELGLDVVLRNDVKVKHLYSVSVDKNYKEKRKRKMYDDSMIYYHFNYHNINLIQRILLRFVRCLDILLSKKR